ncbi:MAG: DUF3488 and DUF4129 domain-containing transglutaminase family protein [Ktedonobacterales bacterium]
MQATTTTPRTRRDSLTEAGPWLRLTPEDGWLTLVLLMIMVFTTIASIQSATPAYAPGLDILTLTTLCGLVLGYLVVQQGRLPGWLTHLVAIALGTLFAFKETADEVLGGDRTMLLRHVGAWFQQVVVTRGSSSDNAVFLLFLAILSFLLAYISLWLVLHTRRPWLAALANAIVLLINLNFATTDRALFFLVLYLLATLLLLVRFSLAENMRQWRQRGLRFSPDLGWDFMQAGAIFAVIVLLMAYLLPAGSANQSLLSAWNSSNNPWTKLEGTWSSLFAGLNGSGVGNGGLNFFGDSVVLQGKVTLPKTVILRYTLPISTDDPTQYLMTQSYDTYNGTNQWTNQSTQAESYKAGDLESTSPGVDPSTLRTDTFDMVFAVPQGNHLFVAGSEPQSFNTPAVVNTNAASAVPVQWNAVAPINPGAHYVSVGYDSTASRLDLEAVPYPKALSIPQAASLFPPDLMNEYLSSSETFSPDVVSAAQEATKGTTNMYDAAEHLESYLHVFKYSTDNPEPPANQDAVSWFLKTKQGFCTFFASAMTLMARSLGMPARIAVGFTNGQYDSATSKWVVRGTDAHVWTQIYFAKYGWVNFEPTSSFVGFLRGSTAPKANGSPTPVGSPNAQATATPRCRTAACAAAEGGGGANSKGGGPGNALVGAGLGLSLLIILALLCVFLFSTWWRLLYRGLTPVTAAFARVARLGAWAGVPAVRTQTPDEYADRLGELIPGQRGTLRRLSTLYARERWGGGMPPDEAAQIPTLYDHVRRSVLPVIVQRVRSLPARVWRGASELRRSRRRRREW